MFAAAILSLGSAAQAEVYNGSFSGTLRDGSLDATGYFVAPSGGDLSGKLISGTFSYDTANAAYDGNGNYVGADDTFFLSFALTIDAVTYSFKSFAADPVYGSVTFTNAPDSVILILNRSGTDVNSGQQDEQVTLTFQPTVLVGLTAQPFSATGELGSFNLATNRATANGLFDVNQASVTLANTAIPEPETWSQMILGLAMIGAMMRLRRGVDLRWRPVPART